MGEVAALLLLYHTLYMGLGFEVKDHRLEKLITLSCILNMDAVALPHVGPLLIQLFKYVLYLYIRLVRVAPFLKAAEAVEWIRSV